MALESLHRRRLVLAHLQVHAAAEHVGLGVVAPELSLEEVLDFAAAEGFACVEVMCWPKGKAERRYAGVTHVDVARLDAGEAHRVNNTMAAAGVAIRVPGKVAFVVPWPDFWVMSSATLATNRLNVSRN
mgnify:CR=1 FL=1